MMASVRLRRVPAVPGIPSAPIGKDYLNDADREFELRKKKLGYKLPIMSEAEVIGKHDTFHVNILHATLVAGYYKVVNEVNLIGKLEEHDRRILKLAKVMNPLNLVEQKPKLRLLLEVLKDCHDSLLQKEDYCRVTILRKECAEKFLKENDFWLAKYMFGTALKYAKKIKNDRQKDRLIAEIHCLLVFAIRETEENSELAFEEALPHLIECRQLAEHKTWHLKPELLVIKLKKPVAILGLRDEYEIIDGSTMLLYNIACLLEHEMLLAITHMILHHKTLNPENVKDAEKHVNAALQLAYLVREPTALLNSLLRFGTFLRHTGENEKAIEYFQDLVHQAENAMDPESVAIGYHEIGLCYIGKLDIVTGLEYLIKEKELGGAGMLIEIQANAMQHIAHILLEEGQLWEAEECYYDAYHEFLDLRLENEKALEDKLKKELHDQKEKLNSEQAAAAEDDEYDSDIEDENSKRNMLSLRVHERRKTAARNYCDRDFAFSAIGAGEKLWGQYTGLMMCENDYEMVESIVEWRNFRRELPLVPRPDYNLQLVEDVYTQQTSDDQLDKEDTTGPATENNDNDVGVETKIFTTRRSTIKTLFRKDSTDEDTPESSQPSAYIIESQKKPSHTRRFTEGLVEEHKLEELRKSVKSLEKQRVVSEWNKMVAENEEHNNNSESSKRESSRHIKIKSPDADNSSNEDKTDNQEQEDEEESPVYENEDDTGEGEDVS